MKRTGVLMLWLPLVLGACGDTGEMAQSPTEDRSPADDAPAGAPAGAGEAADYGDPAEARLAQVLAAQPDEVQARYEWRHPEETLRLFRVEPGQTVVEVLPGGGWYTRILLPYLGSEGRLIGVDYEASMWPKFGFMDEATVEARVKWPEQWPEEVAGWAVDDGASVEAYTLGTMPESLTGTVDRVLFIRALHNLARFEDEGGYLTTAIEQARRVLEPGGLVGVVQHRAPNDASDEWADGEAGYLKEAFVKRRFLEAGFELVMESGINRNHADEPTEEDVVWRLPPSLNVGEDDPELRARMEAIGESDRMTLVFRKPR